MKPNPFLSALRRGHYSALSVSLMIRHCSDKVQCDASGEVLLGLPEMVRDFLTAELEPHLAAEESLVEFLQGRLDRKNTERLRSEHRYLISLVEEGSLESLDEFSVVLAAHIRFAEEELFPSMEDILDPVEKRAVALFLGKAIPEKPKPERGKEPGAGKAIAYRPPTGRERPVNPPL